MNDTRLHLQTAAADRILLAAHRGVSGGNIPCNTLEAYEIALRQGADIVEIDIAVTADRSLYVFHPGMERPHLDHQTAIKEMQAEEVLPLRYGNQDMAKTEYKISTIDEVFSLLKGRCIINIDKFWTAMPEITEAVRRHGLTDQVIVKTAADPKYFRMVEEIAPELPYMPIVSETDTCCEMLRGMKLNYIGAEVLFRTELSDTAQPEYIERMHKMGLLLWANAIIYNYKSVLAAGHSDDYSLTRDPEQGWGWLADHGYDIIQTDWTLPARLFLEETGRRYKNK
ncbi:MAG: glycerophosphodiester phosphodiesterase family protein [Clostridia bacterium]|nr:glycerophosphodiester phosphodiesterase family protein [Clostridia bacterium]